MWTCPECGKAFRLSGQTHSCVVVELSSHFPAGKAASRRLFDQLHNFIRSIDPLTRLSVAKTRIGFINGITFAAVNKIGTDTLDMHFLLGRRDSGAVDWLRREEIGAITVHHCRMTHEMLGDDEFRAIVRESVAFGHREEWIGSGTQRAPKTNVVLRNVRDVDLGIFFAHQKDPGANRMAAFMPRDLNDRDAFLAHWEKILADVDVTIRSIVFHGKVAGYVGSFEHSGKPEVCYWIGKDYWGKGIATSALSQFLTEVKVRPLYAGVAGDNFASIRVLEKCGFAAVGREKSFSKARGETIDEVIMKLV